MKKESVMVTYVVNSILIYWKQKPWVYSWESRPISKFFVVGDSIIIVFSSFFFLNVFDSVLELFVALCQSLPFLIDGWFGQFHFLVFDWVDFIGHGRNKTQVSKTNNFAMIYNQTQPISKCRLNAILPKSNCESRRPHLTYFS